MILAADEPNAAYLKKHLGELKEIPRQLSQWIQFLKKEIDITIDMERVFQSPNLSQEHKIQLNEYQRCLKEKGPQQDDEQLDERHEEFMNRTETALDLFKKSPDLTKEYGILNNLYIGGTESHIAKLEQNDITYEKKKNELKLNTNQTLREALERCITVIADSLKLKQNIPLTEQRKNELQDYVQTIENIRHLIASKDPLSDDIMRSCCSQLHDAINYLETSARHSNTSTFETEKTFLKDQSEKKSLIPLSVPVSSRNATERVKERLMKFKKEFQPQASNVSLDSKTKDVRAVDLMLQHKDAKNIEVLFDKEKLWYEEQAKTIQSKKNYNANNPDPLLHDSLEQDQKILASLLLATVQHAIKTDDPSLLQRLVDAGANLDAPLEDGTVPMDLVKNKEGLKVHQWLSKYIKEQDSNPMYVLATANLQCKHKENEQAIIAQYDEELRATIKNTCKFFDYSPEKQIENTQSEQQHSMKFN